MNVKDFWYDLPEELIAQSPLEDRASSRLLVVDKKSGEVKHEHFRDIKKYLKKGDCLVINDTKVIPARIFGTREGFKGKIEVLLLKRKDSDIWEALVKPGKKCKIGTVIDFGELKGEIIDIIEDGNRLIKFSYNGIFEEVLDRIGQMPLPPYINHELKDKNRYQTVYAKYDGSAAAPTAGLHFTKELLKELEEMGVNIAYVTLHVGLGTFRPVKVVSKETADLVNKTKQAGNRVICVGTTSCRTIESATENGKLMAKSDWTSIFIYPSYEFKITDGLITNFHLPSSTLIMLVSAFMGREKTLEVYKEAVREKYRFFSFGDASMIV